MTNATITPGSSPDLVLPKTRLASPKKHNHYGFQDFFRFDPERGVICDWNGSQNFLTSEDFIIGMVEGLEEEVGDASAAIMYSILS